MSEADEVFGTATTMTVGKEVATNTKRLVLFLEVPLARNHQPLKSTLSQPDPHGSSGINTTNHYRYATGYTDPTGLTKLGARYYNPALGRFTQTDPSGQEENAYAYASGDPSSVNDPTGLCGEWYDLTDVCENLEQGYYDPGPANELEQCLAWGVPAAGATEVATWEAGPFTIILTAAAFAGACGAGALSEAL